MKKRIVVTKQSDVKDCGPCCLKSIVEYHGGYVSLEKIRNDCNTSLKGTSVYHLVNAAKKYGFNALAKKYLDKNINRSILPAIALVHYPNGFDHFICIYEIDHQKVLVMDPAKGNVTMNIEEFKQLFTGVIIELSPKASIVHFKKNNSLLKIFWRIILQNKKMVFKMFLSSIILVVLTIGYSFYFKVNYESLHQNGSINLSIILFFVSILVLKIMSLYLKLFFENVLNKKIDLTVITNFLRHIFNLPLKIINNKSTGEIVTRINELYNLKDLFSQIFINLFVEIILSFGALLILIKINGYLTLILCLFLGLYFIFTLMVNSYIYRRISQNIDLQTNFNSTLIDNINMINSYKNLNAINVANQRNKTCLNQLIDDNFDVNNKMNNIDSVKNSLLEMGIFVLNTVGFYYIYRQQLLFIDLVLFNSIMGYTLEPIKTVSSLLPKVNFLRASYLKICDFIDIDEEKLGELTDFINGDIVFNDVSFSYNQYVPNLQNVNFRILKGEKVLLNGKSGCGKSTICALLEKIYDSYQGSITIAGKNISEYSIKTIRSNITYVGQKECLMTGTIKDNILFGRAENEDFAKVNKICMIDDIVEKKQFRYESGIDSHNSDLSGGEKQRIILARALLKECKILILDEALSEVDMKTEEQIINNLINSYPEKTIIYVSHKNHNALFEHVIDFESINKTINYES